MCYVMTQGVVASAEELRQTFLQPEGAEPQQEEVEPVEGFIQQDLFGRLECSRPISALIGAVVMTSLQPGGDDDPSDGEQQGALLDDAPAQQDFLSTGRISVHVID